MQAGRSADASRSSCDTAQPEQVLLVAEAMTTENGEDEAHIAEETGDTPSPVEVEATAADNTDAASECLDRCLPSGGSTAQKDRESSAECDRHRRKPSEPPPRDGPTTDEDKPTKGKRYGK